MTQDIPEKQWAQVIEKTGGPVDYKEIPVQKPGPDEVLVNIKYSGVCHTDLHAVNGDWPLATKLPLVGGHEGAGVVVARGELVKDIEVGDHAGVKIRYHTTCYGEWRLTFSCSGSTVPAWPVTFARPAMSPSAPRLYCQVTLSMELFSNTVSPRLPMLQEYPKTSSSTPLLLSSVLVSPFTRD